RRRWSTAYSRRATAAMERGDAKSARGDYRRCRELREALFAEGATTDRQIALMVAQGRCGEHARAAAAAERLIAAGLSKKNAAWLAHAAGALSVCVPAADHADERD